MQKFNKEATKMTEEEAKKYLESINEKDTMKKYKKVEGVPEGTMENENDW